MVIGLEAMVDGAEEEEGEDDDDFEIDLEDLEAQVGKKFLAIARYFSGKSYFARGLFEEMQGYWGVNLKAPAKVLDANKFLLEFHSEYDRNKVVLGGPWRHKGDAVIVVNYDGLTRPSEVVIESILLWVRLYDLPPVMMSKDCGERLGRRFGRVTCVDTRFTNYLRLRVVFPLGKVLVPEMIVRVKGRSEMAVKVRYENVPHFCFICGRIGHAKGNCPDEDDDSGVRYGEELRALPPKRMREVPVKPVAPKVVRALNYVGDQKVRVENMATAPRQTSAQPRSSVSGGEVVPGASHVKPADAEMRDKDVTVPAEVASELASGIERIFVQGQWVEINTRSRGIGSREFVSLENMTSDEATSDGRTAVPLNQIKPSASDRFNARKNTGNNMMTDKKQALKVASGGRDIEKIKKGKVQPSASCG
ncbi:hypothetical protein EJB05_20156, partial [Eragrostis curvula]